MFSFPTPTAFRIRSNRDSMNSSLPIPLSSWKYLLRDSIIRVLDFPSLRIGPGGKSLSELRELTTSFFSFLRDEERFCTARAASSWKVAEEFSNLSLHSLTLQIFSIFLKLAGIFFRLELLVLCGQTVRALLNWTSNGKLKFFSLEIL